MAQNKGLNIALLAAVFAVSTGLGFFLSQMLVKPRDVQEVVVPSEIVMAEEEPVSDFVDSTAYYDSVYNALLAAEAAAKAAAEAEAEAAAKATAELPQYAYFSDQQMQDLINSGDYSTNRPADYKGRFLVAGKITVTNLPEEYPQPGDIQELCSNLGQYFGDQIWSGVTNVRCRRNEQTNQIVRITLEVIWEDANEN